MKFNFIRNNKMLNINYYNNLIEEFTPVNVGYYICKLISEFATHSKYNEKLYNLNLNQLDINLNMRIPIKYVTFDWEEIYSWYEFENYTDCYCCIPPIEIIIKARYNTCFVPTFEPRMEMTVGWICPGCNEYFEGLICVPNTEKDGLITYDIQYPNECYTWSDILLTIS